MNRKTGCTGNMVDEFGEREKDQDFNFSIFKNKLKKAAFKLHTLIEEWKKELTFSDWGLTFDFYISRDRNTVSFLLHLLFKDTRPVCVSFFSFFFL